MGMGMGMVVEIGACDDLYYPLDHMLCLNLVLSYAFGVLDHMTYV